LADGDENSFLAQTWRSIDEITVVVKELDELASKHPYYK
jgi:hypothetical protein